MLALNAIVKLTNSIYVRYVEKLKKKPEITSHELH